MVFPLLSPPPGDLAVARPRNGYVHRGRRQHLRWQSAGAAGAPWNGKKLGTPKRISGYIICKLSDW